MLATRCMHNSDMYACVHVRAQVSVELYVPHTGEHAKDTFWPCTFNLSKVILVSRTLILHHQQQQHEQQRLLGVWPRAGWVSKHLLRGRWGGGPALQHF